MRNAPTNMMMLRRDPPVAGSPLPPLRKGVETKQEVEEEKVVVPLVPHVVVIPLVADQFSVEGLVDPPKGLALDVRLTRSAGNTIALEATQELKEARAKDIFKENAIHGGV